MLWKRWASYNSLYRQAKRWFSIKSEFYEKWCWKAIFHWIIGNYQELTSIFGNLLVGRNLEILAGKFLVNLDVFRFVHSIFKKTGFSGFSIKSKNRRQKSRNKSQNRTFWRGQSSQSMYAGVLLLFYVLNPDSFVFISQISKKCSRICKFWVFGIKTSIELFLSSIKEINKWLNRWLILRLFTIWKL